jgi:hypothetical protein
VINGHAAITPESCSGSHQNSVRNHPGSHLRPDCSVRVGKLQSWLDGGGKNPNEQAVKSRLTLLVYPIGGTLA